MDSFPLTCFSDVVAAENINALRLPFALKSSFSSRLWDAQSAVSGRFRQRQLLIT
jgi:hypothetical protein